MVGIGNYRKEVTMDFNFQSGSNQKPDGASKFIPAMAKTNIYDSNRVFRACAYCRVSTDNDEQKTSFALQKEHYQQLAGSHPNWDLRYIFADEGISGTSLKNRVQFSEMIERCEAGEFDLILTKSVSRFARNLVDCLSLVRKLKNHNPPIGVFFETDNLFTLAEDSELRLSILASFAQEESVKKSESMNWSLQERFKKGDLLMPELYGYRRPRNSEGRIIKHTNLEIYEPEAIVIRFIFDAFLSGYTTESIANILTENEIPTKTGGTKWNEGSVSYILKNERYCGSVLTWKTFTADIFEHKKRKNHRNRDQYLYQDNHEPIVSIQKFEAVQELMENRKHGMRGLHIMHVIDVGVFAGYIPINHHWINDSVQAYFEASNSVKTTRQERRVPKSYFSAFDLEGYEVVREQFLTTRHEMPALTIANEKISFNSKCFKKMAGATHIQLLLHPTQRKIAIRPCTFDYPYAISIQSRTGDTVSSKSLTCASFIRILYCIMGWNPDYYQRIIGTLIEKGNDQIIVFNLCKAMPLILLDEEKKKRIGVCPEEWDDFGSDFYDYIEENEFYYLSGNDLGSDVRGTPLTGQLPFEIDWQKHLGQYLERKVTDNE